MKASFRDYINTLRANHELQEITKPVDLRNVAALVAQAEKALLFRNVIGYRMPVVSGLLRTPLSRRPNAGSSRSKMPKNS